MRADRLARMNYGGRIVSDMKRLVSLFVENCDERTTLDELASMFEDHELWPKAHRLFERIREKTLIAGHNGNSGKETQYLFEEICAKTLYNLSHESAPFDPDSPYWVVPNAFALARSLDIDEGEVLAIVSA